MPVTVRKPVSTGSSAGPTKRIANFPSTAGIFATLRALFHTRGSGARSRRHALATLSVLATALAGGLLFSSAPALAAGEGCPNGQIRKAEPYGSALPDCRAYEQVSPVDKNNTDADNNFDITRSSPSGERVSYYSVSPFPGAPSPAEEPTYISARVNGEWSTQGLLPLLPAGAGLNIVGVVGLTEDLSRTIVYTYPNPPLNTPEATPGFNYYIRNNVTGAYSLFTSMPGFAEDWFADANTNDQYILFESTEQLLPAAQAGTQNVYEWDEAKPPAERLSLVDLLPGETAPPEGAVAGAGGPLVETPAELGGGEHGGSKDRFYTQNTISANGSRIFFTDIETGRIYVREPLAEPAVTIPVSAGTAYWRAATPDGHYVFYTEAEKLYRFDVETREPPLELASSGIKGVLGVSVDGAYAYYVDSSGGLHEWHEGAVTSIADLNGEGEDTFDWLDHLTDAPESEKRSRVTPDGAVVLFASNKQLTSYPNAGQDEFYRYDATAVPGEQLTCVSCNPDGQAATTSPYINQSSGTTVAPLSANVSLSRNLSSNGDQIFFDTKEALIPADTNDQMNVYEWEAPGSGSCVESAPTFSLQDRGCLYLISTGHSPYPSLFGDASVSGEDVFFFTRQSLVAQDQDDNVDVYDAREDGGLSSQNEVPVSPCGGEGCRGSSAPTPVFGTPSSVTFSGAGNLAPPAEEPKPVVKPKPEPKTLTRAQQLTAALKACNKRPKRQRARCEAQAHKRYGTKAKKSDRGGK
jgi:hypothetical protein